MLVEGLGHVTLSRVSDLVYVALASNGNGEIHQQ